MTETAPPDPATSPRPGHTAAGRPTRRGRNRVAGTAVLLCLLSGGALPFGCTREQAVPASQPAATSPAGSVVVLLGGKPFHLEVAATDTNRQLGLMFRKSMAADAGMVFVFRREQELGFWMKNTEIPLDIIYLDAAGRVVSVKQMEPHDLRQTPSDGRSKYAIELNKGTAAQLGLKPGDLIDLPERVRNPPDLE